MKVCTKCGLEKTLDSFSKRGNGYVSHCKQCRSARYREYSKTPKEIERNKSNSVVRKETARACIKQLKNHPCTDCGKIYPYYNMQFDHLGDKEWTLGRLVGIGASKAKIDSEVAKCELVCVLCHGDRTHRRRIDIAEDSMV